MTDTRKVEERLSDFFNGLLGGEASVNSFEDVTVGWETRIIAFRLLQPGGEALDLVAKIFDAGSGTKAEREFEVIRRLGSAGYPVPAAYAYDASTETLGAPFIVIEKITGGTLWDVFFAESKEKQGGVLALNTRLMAQLHDIPPAKVLPGEKALRTRRRVLDIVEYEERQLDEHGLRDAFTPLVEWLTGNAEGVSDNPPCVIHRDFHPRNILLRRDGTPAVVDWASCAIGDFREDLCWTALLAGAFIDEPLKMEVYESYRKASARDLEDLHYFEAYSGLRRLADAAITFKAGANARGMRAETIGEMTRNRSHYARVLSAVVEATGESMPGIARLLGV